MEPELVIPTDLRTLGDEELETLRGKVATAFDAIYSQTGAPTDADIEAMSTLAEAVEAVRAEQATRGEAVEAREAQAAALAARFSSQADDGAAPADSDTPKDDTADDAEDSADDADTPDEDKDEGAAETVAASAGPRRVALAALRPRRVAPVTDTPQRDDSHDYRDVLLTADGEGTTVLELASRLDRRLSGATRAARERASLARIERHLPADQVVESNAADIVAAAFAAATDEKRLPGGSLIAAGGWCAPSETLYDIPSGETTEGIISLPTIGVARGGISYTMGPKFQDLYGQGFYYTEAEDIAGDYDGAGGGEKPFYSLDCPEFVDVRLDVAGIAVRAGLLQARGYPELLARVISGVMVGHEHYVAGKMIASIVDGSTKVQMPTATGAAAPVLRAIELQVEAYRTAQRLSRTATLEAVFPFWARGLIRSDLALRTGVDLLGVTDQQIDTWFQLRGVAAQFVYDWQDLDSAAVAYPAELQFLLYRPGTWVKGTQSVVTLDTVYDSTLLGTNDYTALFTEEGVLVAQRSYDSRAITLQVCANGATGAGELLDCAGAPAA